MANNPLRKKESKRMTCKKRYKIEKRVRQHKKKLNRLAKKNPKKRIKPKDPGIPNSLPFKDKILHEAQMRKERQEEMKKKQKEDRKKLLLEKRGLTGLTADAAKRNAEFEMKEKARILSAKEEKQKLETRSLKTFYKEFQKVVEAADVVIQVLDARDPLGTRCPEVEKAVLAAGSSKRLVLVVNKIDLVPSDNLVKWLKHLKNEFPTVPFKASTQVQKNRLSRGKYRFHKERSEEISKTSCCLGAELLMKLLGNYCRNRDIRTSIRVGIVGFPNVGKSSIINSLKRSRACTVGATPGVTRSMQEVQLDKHVVLLDSPGIVLAKGGTDVAAATLRNTVKVEKLEDFFPAVGAILRRTSKQQMMLYYRLKDYENCKEFLALLAKRFGKLKRHGLPDVETAAKMLIRDWNTGKLKYYTRPPEAITLPAHISSEIVSEMSKEFDLDSLQLMEAEQIETLTTTLPVGPMDAMEVEGRGLTEGTTDGLHLGYNLYDLDTRNIEEVSMETEVEAADTLGSVEKTEVRFEEKSSKPQLMSDKRKKRELLEEKTGLKPSEAVLPGNQKFSSNLKQALKMEKKKQKRTEKLADKLCDNLASMSTIGTQEAELDENYDFKTDYQ